MKNIMIYISCVLIDFEDVQIQINTIVNNILFELAKNDYRPTFSVRYQKDGLVIGVNDLENLMESLDVIVNNLENYGWLDSVIKIELIDLISDRSSYLIPKGSIKDRNNLSSLMVPNFNQSYSKSVNFN